MDASPRQSPSIKLAIVGCGAIADYLHAPAIVASAGLELVAAADSDRRLAERLAAKYRIPRVASSIAEIADEVDAVVLSTPPHVRPALVEQACDRGLHILCEKPLANTVSECKAMTAAAASAGRVLAVGHQYRFWPCRIWVDGAIARGKMGDVVQVEVSLGQPYSWKSTTGYTVRRELVSGGLLINAGIHTLDCLLWWFGEPADVEYYDDALGGLESNCRLRLSFSNNIVVNYRQSRTCQLANEIRLHWSSGRVTILSNSEPFTYWTQQNGHRDRREFHKDSLGSFGPARDMYNDFAAAVRDRRQPRVDGAEGTRVVRLVEECYRQKHARALPVRAPCPGLTW